MNNRLKYYLLLSFFLTYINGHLHGQSFICEDAIRLSSAEIFQSDEWSEGGNLQDYVNTFCTSELSPSVFESFTEWFFFDIEESGDLTFVITPKDNEDLDFVVYTSAINSCDSLSPVRCMFSGETQGSDSEPCMGATGLMEGETDTNEGAGCINGSNNFLSPLAVEAGQRIYMTVHNFSASGCYTIETSGTAVTTNISEETLEFLNVYPNPAYDILYIEGVEVGDEVILTDISGAVLKKKINSVGSVNISGLSSGVLNLYAYRSGVLKGVQKVIKID